ncbi:hypothetical protein [uncultured Williamsia sp.]|uniref:hypothetical protein n=1 Tax=uncultured Williamsia sp. TaxID=259311 RepID=UPI002620D4C1|nr:hypothetical protein [uncultured Williamsia sp.]
MRSSRPEVITVRMDRESVAMGDDVESHEEFWDYPADATVDDLLTDIASSFVASVAGDVGWVVRLMNGKRKSTETLGLIYCTHVGGATTICRPARAAVPLSRLTSPIGIDVYVAYLPGARPRAVADMRRSRSRDSERLDRRLTRDGAPDAPTWRQVSDLRAADRAGAQRRREWLRHHLLRGGPRLTGSEEFVANAMHLLYDSLCPASLALTAEVFEIPHQGHPTELPGWQVTQFFGDAPTAALAMVLCAFEWRMTNLSWEHGENELGVAYLGQLAWWGYPLSAPEEVLAGIRDIRDVVG